MEKKKDAFQPLMNVPFSFIADQAPKTGEGEYGPWFLNLGKVNGVDSKFFTNEDLGFKLGQEYSVVKQQGEGKSYTWIVQEGTIKTPQFTQPVQKAPIAQPAPQNAPSLIVEAQEAKERWIRLLACLKATNPADTLDVKVIQAFHMERLLREGIELLGKNGEVTTDFIQDKMSHLEVPF